jgi:DNA invertase Pin-like site-specific DNA recombinase
MLAAIYIRKSREDKDKPAQRLQVQREQLPAHARSQGWKYEIYDDGHASAARGKVEDLKERARLEADIRKGKINVILVLELSRISRDDSAQDYVAWLHLCSEYRVKLATLSRTLDPAIPSDWAMLFIEGGFSGYEMKILKARMREGFDRAFATGRFLGGIPPPPYRYDPTAGKPVIDPEQLPRMKQIWKLAETTSAKAIASAVSAPEIFIRRAISDERLYWYQSKRLDPHTGDYIPCDWEPCMEADQANRIRTGRRSRKNNGVRRPWGALLSNLGILYCGYCGRTVKTSHNSRLRNDGTRNDYYGCQAKDTKNKCAQARLIPQWLLDEKVTTAFINFVADIEALEEYWLATRADTDPAQRLKALEVKEGQVQGKKQRLVTAITDGVIDFADAKIKMADLNSQLESIKTERLSIQALLSEAPDWGTMQITGQEFEKLDQADQRQYITLSIKRIDIHQNFAIITWNFPKNSRGETETRLNFPPVTNGYIKQNKT